MVIDVPLYSTKDDVKDFNNWYLEQIGVILPPTSDVCEGKDKAEPEGCVQKVLDCEVNPTAPMTLLQTKVESEGPRQDKSSDKNTTLLPSVNLNEQVVHAMSLPSSHTNNFEGPYTVHHNLNMENMLVMFLTFLRMLYFAQPQLS